MKIALVIFQKIQIQLITTKKIKEVKKIRYNLLDSMLSINLPMGKKK